VLKTRVLIPELAVSAHFLTTRDDVRQERSYVAIVLPLFQLQKLASEFSKEAVFSGRTAAWLHGLDPVFAHPVEVTLPRLSRTSRLAGASLSRSADDEITLIDEVRVTSTLRTAADSAGAWLRWRHLH
jgi:hypothetical protein